MGPATSGLGPRSFDVFAASPIGMSASPIGMSVVKFMLVTLGARGGPELSRRPPIGDNVSCLTMIGGREGVVLG